MTDLAGDIDSWSRTFTPVLARSADYPHEVVTVDMSNCSGGPSEQLSW
jgi:hypothetical protein